MKLYFHLFRIALATSWCFMGAASAVWAQSIIPDGTLSTQVSSPDGRKFVITDGNSAGGNLFHSFSQFSVPTGGSALFDNAPDIVNIIGRVTGGSLSNIDGLLKANGSANLFLINPNGIIFGSGAELKIGGSFLASTASAVKFADGTEFSATATGASPLLTMKAPMGLQYNGNSAGIEVREAKLKVLPGKTLALIGGNLSLNRGEAIAEGGRVELAGVQGTGTVGLKLVNNQWQLSFPSQLPLANISLTNGTLVSTTSYGGGDIQLTGRQIKLVDSRVEANTLGSSSGGGLHVFSSDSVEIIGNDAGGTFGNGLFAENRGSGTGGGLTITTGDLLVRGEARISTATAEFSAGQGGDLTVNANGTVKLIGIDPPKNSTLFTGLLTDAHGKGAGGDLTINTGRLIVQDGAQVTAATYGAGNGGNLTVKATQDVQLLGRTPSDRLASGLFTAVQPGTTGNAGNIISTTGNAGNIIVDTRQLIVRGGAQIFTGTLGGAGKAGNLTVNATDSIELQGSSPKNLFPSGLFSASVSEINRPAGDIKINTGQLTIQSGAQINATNVGQGNGGSIDIQASKLVIDDAGNPNKNIPGRTGGIKTTTVSGEGGNITLHVGDLLLMRNGGAIATDATLNQGNGGNININTDIFASLENSNTTAKANAGRGGNINITAQGIFRSPNSEISASSQVGISGQVNINTPAIDPSKGFVVLPTQVVRVEGLVAQGCSAARLQASNFTVTGRGGLPPNPNETLAGETVLSDWGTPAIASSQHLSDTSVPRSEPASVKNTTSGIVEAQGWMVSKNGQVFLTATAPEVTPHNPWINPNSCNKS